MKKILLFVCLFIEVSTVFAQKDSSKIHAVCLSANEMKLFDLITAYRKENGLPYIPLSTQLSYVAQQHSKDLAIYRPDINGCNMHSWSANGKWTACCYTPDHKQASNMWNKPRELTNYTDNGFEIAFSSWHSDDSKYTVLAADALAGWKGSEGHNSVIMNKSIWKNETWNAIGIGIYRGYAVVWFGKSVDDTGSPSLCR